MELKVRGANLHNATVALLPGTDIAIDNQPSSMPAAPNCWCACSSTRWLLPARGWCRRRRPSGQSSSVASSANQFTLVSDVKNTISPIVAEAVGVVVGTSNPDPGTNAQAITPVAAPSVVWSPGAAALRLAQVVVEPLPPPRGAWGGLAGGALGDICSAGRPDTIRLRRQRRGHRVAPVSRCRCSRCEQRARLCCTSAAVLPFANESEATFLVTAPAPDGFHRRKSSRPVPAPH